MEGKDASYGGSRDDVVSVNLPSPEGWTKKFIPKKGGTSRRNKIVFISPTGEEIKNKRQLEQYLKSHSAGVAASEFDWGIGDTPRRSARISEKTKATDTPEGESPKKVQKKSSSKKGAKVKDNVDGERTTAEETEAEEEETRESIDVEMGEAGDHDKGEIATEAETKDTEKLVDDNKGGEVAPEDAVANKDDVNDSEQKIVVEIDKMNMEKPESEETTNEINKEKLESEETTNEINKEKSESEETTDEINKEKPEIEGATNEKFESGGIINGTDNGKPDTEVAVNEINKNLTKSEGAAAEIYRDELDSKEATDDINIEKPEGGGATNESIALKQGDESDAKAETEIRDMKVQEDNQHTKERPTEKVDSLAGGESKKSNLGIQEETNIESKVPQSNC